MTAKEFIRTLIKSPKTPLIRLKVRTEKDGGWIVIEPDEQLPPRIYGFIIEGKDIEAVHKAMTDGKE